MVKKSDRAELNFSRRFDKNVMFSSGRPNQFQVDVEVLGRKSVYYIIILYYTILYYYIILWPVTPGIYLVQSKWTDIPV